MNFIKILEEDRDNIMERGRREGERLNSKKIAQKLLKLGIDIKDIKKVTELSEEEIKKLEYQN